MSSAGHDSVSSVQEGSQSQPKSSSSSSDHTVPSRPFTSEAPSNTNSPKDWPQESSSTSLPGIRSVASLRPILTQAKAQAQAQAQAQAHKEPNHTATVSSDKPQNWHKPSQPPAVLPLSPPRHILKKLTPLNRYAISPSKRQSASVSNSESASTNSSPGSTNNGNDLHLKRRQRLREEKLSKLERHSILVSQVCKSKEEQEALRMEAIKKKIEIEIASANENRSAVIEAKREFARKCIERHLWFTENGAFDNDKEESLNSGDADRQDDFQKETPLNVNSQDDSFMQTSVPVLPPKQGKALFIITRAVRNHILHKSLRLIGLSRPFCRLKLALSNPRFTTLTGNELETILLDTELNRSFKIIAHSFELPLSKNLWLARKDPAKLLLFSFQCLWEIKQSHLKTPRSPDLPASPIDGDTYAGILRLPLHSNTEYAKSVKSSQSFDYYQLIETLNISKSKKKEFYGIYNEDAFFEYLTNLLEEPIENLHDKFQNLVDLSLANLLYSDIEEIEDYSFSVYNALSTARLQFFKAWKSFIYQFELFFSEHLNRIILLLLRTKNILKAEFNFKRLVKQSKRDSLQPQQGNNLELQSAIRDSEVDGGQPQQGQKEKTGERHLHEPLLIVDFRIAQQEQQEQQGERASPQRTARNQPRRLKQEQQKSEAVSASLPSYDNDSWNDFLLYKKYTNISKLLDDYLKLKSRLSLSLYFSEDLWFTFQSHQARMNEIVKEYRDLSKAHESETTKFKNDFTSSVKRMENMSIQTDMPKVRKPNQLSDETGIRHIRNEKIISEWIKKSTPRTLDQQDWKEYRIIKLFETFDMAFYEYCLVTIDAADNEDDETGSNKTFSSFMAPVSAGNSELSYGDNNDQITSSSAAADDETSAKSESEKYGIPITMQTGTPNIIDKQGYLEYEKKWIYEDIITNQGGRRYFRSLFKKGLYPGNLPKFNNNNNAADNDVDDTDWRSDALRKCLKKPTFSEKAQHQVETFEVKVIFTEDHEGEQANNVRNVQREEPKIGIPFTIENGTKGPSELVLQFDSKISEVFDDFSAVVIYLQGTVQNKIKKRQDILSKKVLKERKKRLASKMEYTGSNSAVKEEEPLSRELILETESVAAQCRRFSDEYAFLARSDSIKVQYFVKKSFSFVQYLHTLVAFIMRTYMLGNAMRTKLRDVLLFVDRNEDDILRCCSSSCRWTMRDSYYGNTLPFLDDNLLIDESVNITRVKKFESDIDVEKESVFQTNFPDSIGNTKSYAESVKVTPQSPRKENSEPRRVKVNSKHYPEPDNEFQKTYASFLELLRKMYAIWTELATFCENVSIAKSVESIQGADKVIVEFKFGRDYAAQGGHLGLNILYDDLLCESPILCGYNHKIVDRWLYHVELDRMRHLDHQKLANFFIKREEAKALGQKLVKPNADIISSIMSSRCDNKKLEKMVEFKYVFFYPPSGLKLNLSKEHKKKISDYKIDPITPSDLKSMILYYVITRTILPDKINKIKAPEENSYLFEGLSVFFDRICNKELDKLVSMARAIIISAAIVNTLYFKLRLEIPSEHSRKSEYFKKAHWEFLSLRLCQHLEKRMNCLCTPEVMWKPQNVLPDIPLDSFNDFGINYERMPKSKNALVWEIVAILHALLQELDNKVLLNPYDDEEKFSADSILSKSLESIVFKEVNFCAQFLREGEALVSVNDSRHFVQHVLLKRLYQILNGFEFKEYAVNEHFFPDLSDSESEKSNSNSNADAVNDDFLHLNVGYSGRSNESSQGAKTPEFMASQDENFGKIQGIIKSSFPFLELEVKKLMMQYMRIVCVDVIIHQRHYFFLNHLLSLKL